MFHHLRPYPDIIVQKTENIELKFLLPLNYHTNSVIINMYGNSYLTSVTIHYIDII